MTPRELVRLTAIAYVPLWLFIAVKGWGNPSVPAWLPALIVMNCAAAVVLFVIPQSNKNRS